MNYIQMGIYAAILALGISIGGYTTYTIEHSKVLSAQLQVSNMETKLANQKVEAATILAIETKKVADLESAQIKKNEEIDKSHEAFINTSNEYSVKLANLLSSCASLNQQQVPGAVVTAPQVKVVIPASILKMQKSDTTSQSQWLNLLTTKPN
jgi:hypothetical protein